MITREALDQYRRFEKDLAETSKHICELLIRYDKRYKGPWEEFEIFDEDYNTEKFVECTYYTYCMCERDAEACCFPLEMLFMTDDEINEWIDKKLYEALLEAERKKKIKEFEAQKKAERRRERDLAEYERIKKEYDLK